MSTRRHFLYTAAAASAAFAWQRAFAATAVLPFENGRRPLVAYPQKRELLRLTSRPPQLETPFSVFNEGVLTPNDAFFVRYHLANIPTSIDPEAYRLTVKGRVTKTLSLSLADLKAMPASEIIAVNQCSGNSRGFSEPRVGGGQLGNGAMGNAVWRGVSLKTVLDRAGVAADAKDVTFRGLDAPVLAATPAFVKSLRIDHARDGEVMLAYAMNGDELPILNGYPLRLVVPGYFGTYWIKHVSEIEVLSREFDGYWMKTAYRLPANECACVAPGTKPETTVPISKFAVRSFVTSLQSGAALRSGVAMPIRGIAFDGGSGIRAVELSQDGGTTWHDTVLGRDYGRYSFREWSLPLTLAKAGRHELLVRATSNGGEVQPMAATWNPPGYRRNVIERLAVTAL